jgi:hypothetical protein
VSASTHCRSIGALVALSLLLSFPVDAQQSPWEPLVLIARTSASVHFDAQASSNRDRAGLAPSIGLAGPLARGRFRIELTVVKKGFERTQPTFHWTYLELPLLLEFRSSRESASIMPVAQIGLAPSIAMACSVTYFGVNGPYRGNCRERDPLGVVTPASMTDVGLVLGAGLRIRTGRQRLLFEVRAVRGLTTVEKQSQHRVYSAALGLAFPRQRNGIR